MLSADKQANPILVDSQSGMAQQSQNFSIFRKFVQLYCEVFSEANPLEGVACRQSYKDYVPHYYRGIFGPGLEKLTPRHIKWFRRLEPIFSLPKGSKILDYGGGYGLDSILLAALGYEVTFYEITRHHIAIARALAERFSTRYGPLKMHFVHAPQDSPPVELDAVMLNEVAHHIEPVERVFSAASKMLRPAGYLFLLEPNFLCLPVQLFFLRVRGFTLVELRKDEETGEEYYWGNEHIRLVSDWEHEARKSGFLLNGINYYVPWGTGASDPRPSLLRKMLERTPIARHLLGSHVTMRFKLTSAQ